MRFKKLVVLIMSAVMLFAFTVSASAAAVPNIKTWSPIIVIDDVVATEGDSVFVNIELSNNLYGIMAMTFSIHYDSSAFSFVDYHKGVFKDFYIVDRGNYITSVTCENKNIRVDGTILTLEFKVKEDAAGGTYPIKMAHVRPNEKGENLKNCFANWRGDNINPTLTNGSITIPITQQNCRHSFGLWQEKVKPSCTVEGVEVRNCTVCGKSENRTINKTEHIFEDEWTIDTAATKDSEGVMSIHCVNCNKKTDYVYFPFSIVAEKGFKNNVGDKVSKSEREKLVSYEGSEPLPVKPPEEPQDKTPEKVEPVPEEVPYMDANQLVSNAQKEQKTATGIAGRVYAYLYGLGGKDGIINVIFKAFMSFLKNLF